MREIAKQIEAIPNMMRQEINGIPVERVGDNFRASLPNGKLSGWWSSAYTMASIIDSWTRKDDIAVYVDTETIDGEEPIRLSRSIRVF